MRQASVLAIVFAVVLVGASDARLYALELAAEEGVPRPSPNNEAKPAERPKYPEGYIEEGPLPEGFPPPSEVGQIVEKIYPLCRTYSAEGGNAFWRCFTYLTQHKHEMTAPVIMDYKRREQSDVAKVIADLNAMDVKRMHFVLERPSRPWSCSSRKERRRAKSGTTSSTPAGTSARPTHSTMTTRPNL